MAQAQPLGLPFENQTQISKIFYTANSLHLIKDFLKIFHQYIENTQIFNRVVQGTPVPQHRVLFLIERSPKSTFQKWALFFKYLLKFHNLQEIADLLYQGFYCAGLKKEYLKLATEKGNYFLWPPGKYILNIYCELPGPLEHECSPSHQ